MQYRQTLELFITNNHIKTVLDYGCGDWQSSKLIDWCSLVDKYLGVDVVKHVVDNNITQYSNNCINFELVTDQWLPPKADLIVVKDVFIHLPNYLVDSLINQLLQQTNHLFVTIDTFDSSSNIYPDCYFGGYRPINWSIFSQMYDTEVLLEETQGLEMKSIYYPVNTIEGAQPIEHLITKKTMLIKKGGLYDKRNH